MTNFKYCSPLCAFNDQNKRREKLKTGRKKILSEKMPLILALLILKLRNSSKALLTPHNELFSAYKTEWS